MHETLLQNLNYKTNSLLFNHPNFEHFFNERDEIVKSFFILNIILNTNKDTQSRSNSWYNLSNQINKGIAIGIIKYIPLLYFDKFSSDNKLTRACHPYQAIATWLLHWETNQNTSVLQFSAYSDYEREADEALKRYELIRALFSREKVNREIFVNPEFSWVISQVAIFRRKLKNKVDSKYKLYDKMKQHIDSLEYDLNPNFWYPRDFEEVLDSIDRHFEALARQTVDEGDQTFQALYFKPFILASRSRNANDRQRLQLDFPTEEQQPKRRPGVALGTKKPKKPPKC
jgi:hypothetical protein